MEREQCVGCRQASQAAAGSGRCAAEVCSTQRAQARPIPLPLQPPASRRLALLGSRGQQSCSAHLCRQGRGRDNTSANQHNLPAAGCGPPSSGTLHPVPHATGHLAPVKHALPTTTTLHASFEPLEERTGQGLGPTLQERAQHGWALLTVTGEVQEPF